MSHIEQIIKYSAAHNNKIKKLTAPLFETFGIADFWYGKTTPSGIHSTLECNIDFFDYYFSTGQHLINPVFQNPHSLEPGYYLYINFADETFQSSLKDLGSKLKIIPTIGFVHRNKHNEVIRIGYGIDPTNPYKRNILINNLPLLQEFNRYFIREASDLIKGAEEYSLDLKTSFGKSFNSNDTEKSITLQTKCRFLASILNKDYLDIQKLTSREIDCLKCLYQGLTSNQTAEKLFISPRTVESHLLSIKNKLQLHRKSDLFELCRLLHTAGFFEVI